MSSSSTATFRKIRSPQTMGVDPDQAGSGSFQAMFRSASHSIGRSVSVLTPSPVGPRHAGQCSASATPGAEVATDRATARATRMGCERMISSGRYPLGPLAVHPVREHPCPTRDGPLSQLFEHRMRP